MRDGISLQMVNEKAFLRAVQLAPKRVRGAIRREFSRAGKKFGTQARSALLSGAPGINLPALQPKRGARKAIKAAQKRHILTKTTGTRDRGSSIFLVAYTSKFLTFHEKKMRSRFHAMFKKAIPGIRARVNRESSRITQAIMDKELRDTGIRGVAA